MNELVFNNVIDFIYAIYQYPECDKREKIFELNCLGEKITKSNTRQNKSKEISIINFLMRDLEGSD